MKTKSETTGYLSDGSGRTPRAIIVPAGVRVVSCEDYTGAFFVDDLSWIDDGLTKHDATYRGIRVAADEVE